MKNIPDTWVRVELHCHTNASPDSLVEFEKYIKRCKHLGIEKLAITDHNAIEAALAAKQKDPEMIIVGEEVKTNRGELIGYFLTELVPPGLDPLETINRIKAQGGVVCIPHPFDPFRASGWQPGDLDTLVPFIDAVEIYNARCLENKPNIVAARFANDFALLETVGSDAHTVNEIGNATLIMPDFTDAGTFLAGLQKAKKITSPSPLYTHLFSRFAKFIKKKRK